MQSAAVDAAAAEVEGRHLDATGFDALYQAQLEPVYNYVRYRLGRSEAEDVTAEIFTRAWEHRSRCGPEPDGARAWLWTIARNAVTDRYRRRRGEPRSLAPDEVNETAALARRDTAAGDVAAVALRSLEWPRIRLALDQLAAIDRELLALRFGGGLSHRAIGDVLGLSEANSAQRLRRALRRLREQLEEEQA